jgi:outer membrane protein TolC
MKMRPLFLFALMSFGGANALAIEAETTSTPAAEPADAALSLAHLLRTATAHNLAAIEARAQRERAEASETIALSSMLPQLSLEGGADTDSVSSGGIYLRQSLLDSGSRWRAHRIAQRELEQAKLLEKQALESLTLELLRAYVRVSSVARSMAATERRQSLLETQFDLMSRQYRQGLKTRRDFQRLETERERVALQILKSRETLNESFQALEVLVGDPTLDLNPSTLHLLRAEELAEHKDWPPIPSEFDPARDNLNLRAAALSLEAADLRVAEARRLYWPQISAQASLSYASSGFLGSEAQAWSRNDDLRTYAGLSLKWVLWDWGANSASVAQARIGRSLVERQSAQKKLVIEHSFEDLRARAQRQERAVAVQRKVRDMEAEIFLDMNKEYREGRAGYLDLITTLDRSVQAELDYENEALDAFTATAELLSLKGDLHDAVLKF